MYLKDYESVAEARTGIERYFRFYNQERVHQSLAYRTPAAFSGVIQSSLVNCDPWSVLKISGRPYFLIASSSASTQKCVVSVFDSRQAKTLRLATSKIAIKYMNP